VGNFTGDSDFLYQREIVAGSPKIYGQLVQMLAPYSRVIAEASDSVQVVPLEMPASAPADPTDASMAMGTPESNPVSTKKPATRIRKAITPKGDDAPL
jgi:myo-inositol-1(or 4)-monophosphatase